MNLRIVARLLSGFVLFFALAMLAPALLSLFEDPVPDSTGAPLPSTMAFVWSMVIGVSVAAVLWFAGRTDDQSVFRKEGLAMVGLAWFLAGAIAAVPFVLTDSIPSFVDAYFECISGLTTTGATVLGTANRDIESLAPSVLLWRSMLQWMGGIGIVLVFIVLLPTVGVTGSRLLSSEQVGVADDTLRPRMSLQARRLFQLYVGLTLAALLSYWGAGLSLFDALCHAMTTLATGGFSNHNVSVGGYQNLAVECVAIVFMFLAGCNFLLILRTLTRGGKKGSQSGEVSLHGMEFRVYLRITLFVTAGITLALWFLADPLRDESLGIVRDYDDFWRCLRDGAFQTVSILTSTGYATANFEHWPKAALYLLLLCMFIGGCTGSTAGGFKVLRTIVSFRLGGYTLRHFVRPRSVEKLRVGSEVIPNRVVSAVVGFLVLWLLTWALGAAVLGLDPRIDLMSSLAASTSMMGCIGPAFGEVVPQADGTFELVSEVGLGPYAGYGELRWWAKLSMAVQMVLGRLEILAPLAILTPHFWRR